MENMQILAVFSFDFAQCIDFEFELVCTTALHQMGMLHKYVWNNDDESIVASYIRYTHH